VSYFANLTYVNARACVFLVLIMLRLLIHGWKQDVKNTPSQTESRRRAEWSVLMVCSRPLQNLQVPLNDARWRGINKSWPSWSTSFREPTLSLNMSFIHFAEVAALVKIAVDLLKEIWNWKRYFIKFINDCVKLLANWLPSSVSSLGNLLA